MLSNWVCVPGKAAGRLSPAVEIPLPPVPRPPASRTLSICSHGESLVLFWLPAPKKLPVLPKKLAVSLGSPP